MADRKFTDLQLERSLAGELAIEGATPADRVRLDELRTEHAAFLAQLDVPAEVRAIQARASQLAPAAKPWWRWVMGGGALVAAAAGAFLVLRPRAKPDDDDEYRTKGGGITFVIHTPTRELATGDAVAPGEKIRFEIGAARPGYVAVFGIAGTATTVYYPYGATAPAAYDPHTRVMPGAIALDATPGAEHFYAVYSEQQFAIDAVVGKATLPAGVSAAEVVLEKK